MDPPASRRPACTRRFPRPRGDGPVMSEPLLMAFEVSPPTRGWTTEPQPGKLPEHGFPAHAGMDPSPRRVRRPTSWFPRPRGDGPGGSMSDAAQPSVSPPTRGWTAGRWQAHARPQGFPAHAGMDQAATSTSSLAGGFPRPRGDGPRSPPWKPKTKPVSPPTRGWTRDADDGVGHHLGFPAHAGMDPRRSCRHRRGSRFPRPRGDGPVV